MLKVFGTAAFILGSTLATVDLPDPPFVKYGAFGLLAVVVWFLCRHLQKTAERMEKKDERYDQLIQKDIEAINRLADVLDDRPCLQGDFRLDNRQGKK